LATVAATAIPESRPRSWYELEHRVNDLTEALVAGRPRTLFRMFIPQFQEETGFARFDSALDAWHRGRRVRIGRGKVMGVHGLGAYTATWTVFVDADDYDYVFQSWIYADHNWQLTWLSGILDPSFNYGHQDRAAVQAVRAAMLDWLVTEDGIEQVKRGLRVPDTVLVVDPDAAPAAFPLRGHTTVVRTPTQMRTSDAIPRVPYAFRFALTRVFGTVAICAVDLKPVDRSLPGAIRRLRGIQVFLKHSDGAWRCQSTGKIW
jgi:hypothetical protein